MPDFAGSHHHIITPSAAITGCHVTGFEFMWVLIRIGAILFEVPGI